MTDVLLNGLMPIFAVMALGYLAGWIRDIDNHHVDELNALVMDFALPASLFVVTASTSRAVIVAQWPLLVVLIVSMLALYTLSYWMQRRLFGLGSSEASVQTLTIAQPNYGAAGLPLIVAVFGAPKTIDVALALAAGSIVFSPLTLAILEANKAPAGGQRNLGAVLQAIGRSLRKPIVLLPSLGIVFCLLGIPLAESVGRSFQLIGQAAGGVALFLTGLILSAQRIELDANVLSGTLLKNVVHPLLAVGLILALPMDRDTARVALLLCALPSGFFGVLFGLRYGLESHVAGSTLIVSSLASVVTLAVALVVTAGW
jgi:malonate transporter and related proteins